MANSPNSNAKDLVTFKILSGGNVIKDSYQLFEIEVNYAINQIPRAIIRLHDGNVASKDFEVSNSSDFVPGAEIEIQLGYDNDEQTVFKGIVVSMQVRLDAAEGAVMEVLCRDKAILMTSTRKSAYFTKMMDSDIITKLIGNSGLSNDVDATTTEYEELVQYDASDWDYMMVRAEVNGFLVNVNQGKVSVKKPNVSSSAVLSLTYGDDLIEFEASLNATDQVSGVDAYAWDPAGQAIANQTASAPSLAAQGNIAASKLGTDLGIDNQTIRSSAQIDTGTLQSWADARLLKTRLSAITGQATFIGSALALPDTLIELNGVGDRFSGNAYVTSVRHHVREGNWITEAGFGLDEDLFAASPNVNPLPAAGLTPEYGGLMVAKVKQLDQDPQNENRIMVTLPMMQDDNTGIWARLATYYATNTKGNFFIPEIGDEVILGFMNNDPNFPVILGSLYSSKYAPPYTPSAENYIKAIVTKGDCKIEFDDEKKVITILTPGNNKITLTDDEKGIILSDQNSNNITTSDQGISIKDSNGNEIKMSSSGIDITSSSNIKVSTSAGDVTVSGLNVTNSAQVAMKAEGQATAELSASGQTTVKGAMVMIN